MERTEVIIAEEIESVGREQLHSVQSLLMRALAHMLKVQAWPLTAALRACTEASAVPVCRCRTARAYSDVTT